MFAQKTSVEFIDNNFVWKTISLLLDDYLAVLSVRRPDICLNQIMSVEYNLTFGDKVGELNPREQEVQKKCTTKRYCLSPNQVQWKLVGQIYSKAIEINSKIMTGNLHKQYTNMLHLTSGRVSST